jgi:hypothetical protein
MLLCIEAHHQMNLLRLHGLHAEKRQLGSWAGSEMALPSCTLRLVIFASQKNSHTTSPRGERSFASSHGSRPVTNPVLYDSCLVQEHSERMPELSF